MEADLQRYYRIDLADLFRGRLSWRRLGVLIGALPPESATKSALGPPADADIPDDAVQLLWSVDQHLLAHIVDAVNVLRWTLTQIHSETTIAAPEPLPRPGDPAKVPASLPPEHLALIRARNRHGRR